MSDSSIFYNAKPYVNGESVPFIVGDGKPFFNLEAYPVAFKIPFARVIGTSLSTYVALPKWQRDSAFLIPPQQVLPTAVDVCAFPLLNARLRSLGFLISEKLEAGFLASLRVH